MRRIRCGSLMFVILLSCLCAAGQSKPAPANSRPEQKSQPAVSNSGEEPSSPATVSSGARLKDSRLWAVVAIAGVICLGVTLVIVLRNLSATRNDLRVEIEELRGHL